MGIAIRMLRICCTHTFELFLEQHDACGMHRYVQDVFYYQIKIVLTGITESYYI